MKRRTVYLRLWLLLLTLVGCMALPLVTPAPTPRPTTIELAPDFRLTALAGQPLALSELRGRWVLINFWATWCRPCREEMPYLQTLATTHTDHLAILGINMRESEAEIQPFVDELGITFPILLQPDNETLLAYDVRGLPLTILVTPQGELILRLVGPLQPATMDARLLDLLP